MIVRPGLARSLCVSGSMVFLLSGFAASGARAQQLLAELKLSKFFGTVGDAVGVLGDTGGDGKPELIVAGTAGAIVYSGATFEPLFNAPFGAGELPLAVAGVGDLDGDGVPDFVAATAANLRAHSGADGHQLWVVPAGTGSNFKVFVVGLADLDGDLRPEVAVAESNVPSTPQLRVLSGATGSAILTLPGVGKSLAPIEWNASPGPELLVGDDTFVTHGTTTGRVLVLDPLTGATLTQVVGNPNQREGSAVCSPGDINNDGTPDIVAASASVTGATQAWSGATGQILWAAGSFFPFNLLAVDDVTGDGIHDLVGGGPGGGTGGIGTARLVNGATGALLQGATGTEAGAFIRIALPGDIDGDGLPDLLAGSNGGPFQPLHSARLFSLPNWGIQHVFTNPAGHTSLGGTLDRAGDVDHDGHGDFVLGSIDGLDIFSGATGDLLLDVAAPSSGILGTSISVAGCGDLDGDGVPDVALGNGSWSSVGSITLEGRVQTWSGADGSLLHAAQGPAFSEDFGFVVVSTTDRDGDGARDLLVSAPGATIGGLAASGEVRLVSGATLATLQSWHGDLVANNLFGNSLSAGGDLDGDGVADFAASSTRALLVISSATSAELFRVTVPQGETIFGNIVGDADGDGVDDVLSREPYFAAAPPDATGLIGRVRLWSGATGTMLWEVDGTETGGNLGISGGPAGDVNGDGYADVAAVSKPASAATSSGTLWLYSGRDHLLLDQIILPPGGVGQVLSAGLVDAGGCADVLVGLPGLASNGGAHVYASSHGGEHGFLDLGFAKTGAAGVTPTLSGYGDLSPGALVSVRARHALPSAPGIWFVSLSQGNLPFKQGTLVPGPGAVFLVLSITANAAGGFSITAPNPLAVFTGLSFYHQFWFKDAAVIAGVSATNGLREIFK